ncbi:hypothetical protein GGI07_001383 [Coemansia sp. Benny D115]|nr:hypothetical protein GGI07_001383 [Coemansia sp. Benny D115]
MLYSKIVAGRAQHHELEFTPGKTYTGNETKPYLGTMKKYMRLSEVAYHFLHQGNGFSCGKPCEDKLFRQVMLNTTWHSPQPISDGYIGINTGDKEVYVVWTGTRRVRSIIADSLVIFQEYPAEIPGSSVHSGFYAITNAVYPHILKNIRAAAEDYPDHKVVFLGHSLGGDNEYDKDRIRVWTFGEPRVGNKPFSEYYTQMLGNQTFRVTKQADIVPHVPPWQILGYQHHPLEIHIINKDYDFYVCKNTVREDLEGAYRWPTIDTGIPDHVDYFGMPDITLFDPIIEF